MQERIIEELQAHQGVIARLQETQAEVIEKIAAAMIDCYANSKKVVFFGNGGSAADAQHIAAEFMGRYKMDRKAMAALSLTANSSIITAIGNDIGFEHSFARQVEGLVCSGDVVVGISTSGKAENVKLGLLKAKEKGATTIFFTGKTGGKMQEIAHAIDIILQVPSEDTARTQEAHITVGHIVAGLVEQQIAALGDKKQNG